MSDEVSWGEFLWVVITGEYNVAYCWPFSGIDAHPPHAISCRCSHNDRSTNLFHGRIRPAELYEPPSPRESPALESLYLQNLHILFGNVILLCYNQNHVVIVRPV